MPSHTGSDHRSDHRSDQRSDQGPAAQSALSANEQGELRHAVEQLADARRRVDEQERRVDHALAALADRVGVAEAAAAAGLSEDEVGRLTEQQHRRVPTVDEDYVDLRGEQSFPASDPPSSW